MEKRKTWLGIILLVLSILMIGAVLPGLSLAGFCFIGGPCGRPETGFNAGCIISAITIGILILGVFLGRFASKILNLPKVFSCALAALLFAVVVQYTALSWFAMNFPDAGSMIGSTILFFLDFLILVRIIAAYVAKEKGKVWLVCSLLPFVAIPVAILVSYLT